MNILKGYSNPSLSCTLSRWRSLITVTQMNDTSQGSV